MNLTSEQAFKLAAARYLAVKRAPYLAKGVLALRPTLVKNGTLSKDGTFACDEWGRLYIEPAALDQWTVADVETGLLHEMMHCFVYGHAARRQAGSFDAKRFNVAADAEINDDLAQLGCKMLSTNITPSSLGMRDGLTAEEYYQSNRSSSKCCGGCAGNPGPNEETEPPADAVPVEVIRKQIAADIRAASMTAAKSLLSWAQTQEKPRVIPWQQRLERAVRAYVGIRAGQVDYSYKRPSRRQSAVGNALSSPRLPGLIAPIPRVTFISDTSWSMHSRYGLDQTLPHIEKILHALGAAIEVIACDISVQAKGCVIDARSAVAIARQGGGETDMSPAFAEATGDIVVCATDGYLAKVPPKPRAHVIWLLAGPYPRKPAPYGAVICTDPTAQVRS
jgi:predicted metal-dependent peptidase